jgi:hypothetical protein
MLEQIKIASPCTANWDAMEGDDRVRFCAECKKNVFNISAMTRSEAEALLGGEICVRLYRRADGTVLTSDCPVGLEIKAMRRRRRLSWALGFLSLSPAFAQETATISGKLENQDRTPAANQAVRIFSDTASMDTTTDAEGRFRVTSLAPGKYSIQYGLHRVDNLQVQAGDALTLVVSEPANTVTTVGMVAMEGHKPFWRRIFSR